MGVKGGKRSALGLLLPSSPCLRSSSTYPPCVTQYPPTLAPTHTSTQAQRHTCTYTSHLATPTPPTPQQHVHAASVLPPSNPHLCRRTPPAPARQGAPPPCGWHSPASPGPTAQWRPQAPPWACGLAGGEGRGRGVWAGSLAGCAGSGAHASSSAAAPATAHLCLPAKVCAGLAGLRAVLLPTPCHPSPPSLLEQGQPTALRQHPRRAHQRSLQQCSRR